MLCTSPPPPPASPIGSEISVGAPSPPPSHQINNNNNNIITIKEHKQNGHNGEDYFRPLKRLKMVEVRERSSSPSRSSLDGVKSFSIVDILGHEPQQSTTNQQNNNNQNQLQSTNKIVRPWDHLRGPVVPVRPFLPPALLHYEHRLALDYQRQLQEHLTAQAQLLRHMSMDIIPSESGSDRSSSVASDCCSPEIINRSSDHHNHHRQQQQSSSPHSSGHHQGGQKTKQPNGTPLDALFQMTNKSFDETQGENGSGIFCFFFCFYFILFFRILIIEMIRKYIFDLLPGCQKKICAVIIIIVIRSLETETFSLVYALVFIFVPIISSEHLLRFSEILYSATGIILSFNDRSHKLIICFFLS